MGVGEQDSPRGFVWWFRSRGRCVETLLALEHDQRERERRVRELVEADVDLEQP